MAATLAPLYLHNMPLVMQGARHEGKTALNPILKVVTMLQALQKRVTKCYCKTNGGALEASTAAVNTKIPTAGASIKASEEQKTQLEEEVKKARTDCNDAKTAVSDATALREKEADTFAALKVDLDAKFCCNHCSHCCTWERNGRWLLAKSCSTGAPEIDPRKSSSV